MSRQLTIKKPQKIYKNFNKNAEIVIHTGDTLKFLKTIPDKLFKLTVTSPPYNIGKIYEKRTDIDKYLDFQEEIIAELVRTLHPKGSICWQVGNYIEKGEVFPLDIFFYRIFKKFNLKLRNRVIWHFGHGLHAKNRFSGRYETLLWFTKTNEYTFNLDGVRVPAKYPGKRAYKGKKKGKLSGNPLGKNPSDFWEAIQNDWETMVWDIPNVKSNHPEKTIHPCQFPIELVERCVMALTNKNDWVLDPFNGVGSSIIAAIKNGRRAVGVDKEKEYNKIAENRIRKYFSGDLIIRPLGKPVHKPTGKEKVSQIPDEWKK